MKIFLIVIIAAFGTLTDPGKIARVNKAKKEARELFIQGKFQAAADKYSYLIDSLGIDEPRLSLNRANAYYHLNDSARALTEYSSLLNTKDSYVKSIANQQLGILANKNKKPEEALKYFKDALRAYPGNEEARYNYELVKKMLDQQKKDQQDQNKNEQDKQQDKKENNKDQQNKDDQNKDQKNQDKQNQEQKDQQEKQDQENQDSEDKEGKDKEKQDQNKSEQEKGDEEKNDDQQSKADQPKPDEEQSEEEKQQQEQIADKLKEMNISEEKAQMILEAMKNNEVQYIQQQKKKATKRKDPNKPDW